MTILFNDLKIQYRALKPQIQERINRVLEHGIFIMGPEVQELEEKLAVHTGAKHCITVASGTEALLISLMALGIKPGDEVITTPFTFVATAEVIVLLGAKPVFVDIEPDTCNIDASKIEERITNKTKVIMPVSLYGQPSDMSEINAIAARHGNIPVIEDAAQSFGATYQGKKSCNLSTIGCTSFFPSKPLGCYGDGGAIFTNDDSIAQACKEIRIHGQSARYVHTRVGVGGRMDTIQCAILLVKLERFDWEIKQRCEIGQRYSELISTEPELLEASLFSNGGNILGGMKHKLAALPPNGRRFRSGVTLTPIAIRLDRTSVYAQYTLICSDRDAVQAKLKQANIPTAVHYPVPLNEQAAYKHLCCPDCTPIASRLAKQVISLPMAADLSTVDQYNIVSVVIEQKN
jgi:UDP-2-acetamido-2-deoxy-ribo-hexuluronate aminotransferase